jgi:adenylosuccinate lyase
MVRAYAQPALENVALWHERDISHSSVERYIGPDACITLDFALVRLTGMMENLVLYPDNMLKNLNKLGGLVFSQRMLLALTQNGVSREDAYSLVQRNAMKVWEQGKNFLEECEKDNNILKVLSKEQLRELFNMDYHTKHVETIFGRVFGK